MRVQQVNQFSYNANKPLRSRVGSKQAKMTQIAFKSYESVLRDVISSQKPLNITEVHNVYARVYNELLKMPKVEKGRYAEAISPNGTLSVSSIINGLCQPLTSKMSPIFRDIVINTTSDHKEPVLTISDDVGLFIENHGKMGFWNNIFNSQDAYNDINIVFRNGYKTEFIISKPDKKNYMAVKMRQNGFVTDLIYEIYSLSSQKCTNMGDVHVPVGP